MFNYTYKCDECEGKCLCISEEDRLYTERQHNESLKNIDNNEEPNLDLL